MATLRLSKHDTKEICDKYSVNKGIGTLPPLPGLSEGASKKLVHKRIPRGTIQKESIWEAARLVPRRGTTNSSVDFLRVASSWDRVRSNTKFRSSECSS
jgi:hypothetical protein